MGLGYTGQRDRDRGEDHWIKGKDETGKKSCTKSSDTRLLECELKCFKIHWVTDAAMLIFLAMYDAAS